MSGGSYTFEDDGDAIFVTLETPCGAKVPDVAVILEPDSLNPVLRLRDPSTGEYSSGLGLSGLAKILDYIKSRNTKMN